MNASNTLHINNPPRQAENCRSLSSGASLSLFLLLIIAGLAGNYFHFEIFLNVDFLFGSIFAMLILQIFGLGPGVAAAAVISLYTCFIWNHPYAFVIMTAEAAFVGWLTVRRKTGFVLADTIFWLFLGMPLVFMFFYLVMQSSESNTLMLMAKQSVNGIANTLLARLLYSAYLFRSRKQQVHLSEMITTTLSFFVIIPTVVILAISSRGDFREIDRDIRSSLIQDSLAVTHNIQNWLKERTNGISALARLAEDTSPSHMQTHLEQERKADPNFVLVGLLNRDAVTTAYSPLYDELGNSTLGLSFADRPYLPALKNSLQPMLSEVVPGKIGFPQPRVLLLTPVVSSGAYNGYVAGALSVDQIQHMLESFAVGRNLLVSLLDKNGNIIATNRKDQKIMSPFSRSVGTMKQIDSKISQWMPKAVENIPDMELWRRSLYISESSLGAFSEWKLILELPVEPYQEKLFDRYSQRLLMLLLIFIVAVAAAEMLGRFISIRMNKFSELTRNLPEKLANEQQIEWHESIISEINQLITNFRMMSGSFRELLHSGDIRWRFALEGAGDGVWDWNKNTNEVFFSHRWKAMLGYADEEIGTSLNEWDSRIHPEDRIACYAELEKHLRGESEYYRSEHRMLCKDGSSIWILDRGKVVEWSEEGKPLRVIGTHSDITSRKQTEEALLKASEAADAANLAKGRFLSTIAHEFHTPLGLLTMSVDILDRYRLRLSSEELAGQHEQIRSAARQMTHLVDSVIDFNRHGATSLAETVALPVNVAVLCNSIAEEVNAVWGADHEFSCTIDPECGNYRLDELLLRRVLSNILSNAFRYTPQTGSVSLSVKPLGEEIILEVADTGIGIPEGDREKIFDAFYRSNNVESRSGLGLGLSIVSESLQKLNGRIFLTTTIGEGTVFRVEIPKPKGV